MQANSGRAGVCLVGGGRIGTVHLRNIINNPRLDLKYFVDVDEGIAKSYAAKAPGCKALLSIGEALADPSVVGVVVCSPTATHRDIILASVRAGKAVMCEKPISLKLSEVDECYNEAKKHNVPLLCGYQRRSDPSFVKLRETVISGKIGKVQIVKTMSRDHPVPPVRFLRISGGIFHDCGSHDIDVVRWLTGEDPIEVSAVANAFNPDIKALDDFDTVLINLKMPSGIIASIDLSRNGPYGYDQRIEVLTEKGMVQAMNKQPTSVILSLEDGVHTDPYLHSFPERYEQAYNIELDHFADVMLKGVTVRIGHEDVRKVSIIADAAEHSARTGQVVRPKYD